MTATIIPWPKRMPAELQAALAELGPENPPNPILIELLELLLKNAQQGRIHSMVAVFGADDDHGSTSMAHAGLERGGMDIPGFCLQLDLAREQVMSWLAPPIMELDEDIE